MLRCHMLQFLQCFYTVGWMPGRASIWPLKNCVFRCWRGYLWSKVQNVCMWSGRCRCHPEKPVFSCLVKIHNGLTFLVSASPDCPGNEAIDAYLVKWMKSNKTMVCVCVIRSEIWHGIDGHSKTTNKSPRYIPGVLLCHITRHQRFAVWDMVCVSGTGCHSVSPVT